MPTPQRSSEPITPDEILIEGSSIQRPEDTPADGLVPDYVRRLSWFLDEAIPVIGKYRVGADGFLSFIPGVGDAAGFAMAAVVVLAGVRAGVNRVTALRMALNAVLESTIGLVPLIGPMFAFAWKANSRNLALIEKDLRDRDATRRESWKVLIGMVVALVIAVAIAIGGIVFFTWLVLDTLLGN